MSCDETKLFTRIFLLQIWGGGGGGIWGGIPLQSYREAYWI